jgi:coatomer subunit beta'
MNLQVLSEILRWIVIVNQVWDYQTKSCVQTLEGHTHNVSAVCFHPELPIIVTGSEDGTVRIWHSTTYRLLSILY